MRLRFLGGAGTVTGSKTLVASDRARVLVDCGLFQGLKNLRLRNWERPPFDPRGLDAVALTHAHLDHSGYLPLLVRHGFGGPIYCTSATASLLPLLLEDAAHLQEEDARRANQRGYSRHAPALPLYTVDDVHRALRLVSPVDYDHPISSKDLTLTFEPAGHLLGAASVRVEHRGRSLFLSGDLGRAGDPLARAPRPFSGADALVVESTYGDRLHPAEDPLPELARVVQRVCGRGGVLLIPAFAVGRTQAILHYLADLHAAGAIPSVPTFLNSPMAIDATDIFRRHAADHRLSPQAVASLAHAAEFVRDVEASKALNVRGGPMILIAGSGMATGGRIVHHLATYGPDPKNGVLLVGHQAAGTRGEAIQNGAETVKIFGVQVPIRAERFVLHGLSAHADWKETIAWLRGGRPPAQVFINHGEPRASDALRLHLREELGWEALVAEHLQESIIG